MTQELELAELDAPHQPEGTHMNGGDAERSERRLLRVGVLTLAVLCVTQAALNVSLRFALHSQEAAAPFPLSSTAMADFCQSEEGRRNASYRCVCSCYSGLQGTQETTTLPPDWVTSGDFGSGSGFDSLDGLYDQE